MGIELSTTIGGMLGVVKKVLNVGGIGTSTIKKSSCFKKGGIFQGSKKFRLSF